MKKALAAIALCLLALTALSFACAEEGSGIHLPSALLALDEEVFAGTAVEEVYMPKNLVAVGERAFQDTARLTGIHFAGNTLLLSPGGFIRAGGRSTPPGRGLPEAASGLLFCETRQADPSGENENREAERTAAGDGVGNRAILRAKAYHPRENVSLRPQERTELQPVNYSFP